MSSSNCCFLTCIQVSQEAGQVVWYSHLLQKFPQFIVIHIVKGFGIVNKAEIDDFLKLSFFFGDPADVGNLILVPLPFLKPAWAYGSSQVTYCWSLTWRILSITLLACEMSATVLLQEGGPLPGPETGLLSNTQKWIVQGDTCWQSKRFYWERAPGCRAVGKGTQENFSAMWLAVLGFMIMGLVSGWSLASHFNSESFLVAHALLSQDGC